GSKLGGQALLDFELLVHRHIPVPEARVAEDVPACIPQSSWRGRHKDRITLHVTSKSAEVRGGGMCQAGRIAGGKGRITRVRPRLGVGVKERKRNRARPEVAGIAEEI